MKRFSVFLMVSSLVAFVSPAWGAGSVDEGRIAFNTRCLSCHGDPAASSLYTPYIFDASALTNSFLQDRSMNSLVALGAQTINDIATYLGLPNSNDTDRLLNWGEDTFPQLLSPARQPTQQFAGYTFRFYPNTGVYVATKDSNVWFLDGRTPGAAVLNLGTLRSFLNLMPNGR
jgi:hypothetical protein